MNADLKKEVAQIAKQNNMRTKNGIMAEMIAVGVLKNYLKRGIASTLTNLLLQNTQNKGFCMSKAECTSLYSTKALVKHGLKLKKRSNMRSLGSKAAVVAFLELNIPIMAEQVIYTHQPTQLFSGTFLLVLLK